MNNTAISTPAISDSIHAASSAAGASKSAGLKRKDGGKTRRTEDSAVRVEIDGFGGVSERACAEAVEEEPRGEDTGTPTITAEDVYAFTEAYNRLLAAHDIGGLAAEARSEVYKPVTVGGQGRQISLYETGVAHLPNSRVEGELSVNSGTLNTVLRTRRGDVHALFLCEREGLLRRLCALVADMPGAEEFLRVCGSITQKYIN